MINSFHGCVFKLLLVQKHACPVEIGCTTVTAAVELCLTAFGCSLVGVLDTHNERRGSDRDRSCYCWFFFFTLSIAIHLSQPHTAPSASTAPPVYRAQRASRGDGRPLHHAVQYVTDGGGHWHPGQRHRRQCRPNVDGGERDAAAEWDGGRGSGRVVHVHAIARVRGRGHVHVPGVRWRQLFQRGEGLHHGDLRLLCASWSLHFALVGVDATLLYFPT